MKTKIIEWAETHFEISAEIGRRLLLDYPHGKVNDLYQAHGRGAMWTLSQELTDQFEAIHKGREWDGEWFDELQEFLQLHLGPTVETKPLLDVWDFVEKYYPGYSSSDEIAHNNDIALVVEDPTNIPGDSCAMYVWLENDMDIEKIKVLKALSDAEIYEKSIESFIHLIQ